MHRNDKYSQFDSFTKNQSAPLNEKDIYLNGYTISMIDKEFVIKMRNELRKCNRTKYYQLKHSLTTVHDNSVNLIKFLISTKHTPYKITTSLLKNIKNEKDIEELLKIWRKLDGW